MKKIILILTLVSMAAIPAQASRKHCQMKEGISTGAQECGTLEKFFAYWEGVGRLEFQCQTENMTLDRSTLNEGGSYYGNYETCYVFVGGCCVDE